MAVPMRAKLTVTEVTRKAWGGDHVKFSAKYSDTPEDNSFATATPSAHADFNIDNPALKGTFEPGDTFYVDFTPVEAQG